MHVWRCDVLGAGAGCRGASRRRVSLRCAYARLHLAHSCFVLQPPELMRRFEVQVSPSIDAKASAIRSVHASQIGHLVTIRAIVVRVTDVKPRIMFYQLMKLIMYNVCN